MLNEASTSHGNSDLWHNEQASAIIEFIEPVFHSAIW